MNTNSFNNAAITINTQLNHIQMMNGVKYKGANL